MRCSMCGSHVPDPAWVTEFLERNKDKPACVGERCRGANSTECLNRYNGWPCTTFTAEELAKM